MIHSRLVPVHQTGSLECSAVETKVAITLLDPYSTPIPSPPKHQTLAGCSAMNDLGCAYVPSWPGAL